jgi:hypothetical protein
MQVANIVIDFNENKKTYTATLKTDAKKLDGFSLDGTEGTSNLGPITALEDLIENVWALV